MREAGFERDTASHAVPDEVGALQLQRVEQGGDAPGLEARPVRGADRLVRVAEAQQVHGDRAKAWSQRADRRQEGCLGPAEPVQHQRPACRCPPRSPSSRPRGSRCAGSAGGRARWRRRWRRGSPRPGEGCGAPADAGRGRRPCRRRRHARSPARRRRRLPAAHRADRSRPRGVARRHRRSGRPSPRFRAPRAGSSPSFRAGRRLRRRSGLPASVALPASSVAALWWLRSWARQMYPVAGTAKLPAL